MKFQESLSPAERSAIQHYLESRAAFRALNAATDRHRREVLIPAEQNLLSLGLDWEQVGQDVGGVYALKDEGL